MMDPTLASFLDQLHQQGQENDSRHTERRQRMLNLEPDTAHLLSLFVLSSQRKHILEIGTSNGYSTSWLAWATRQHGGRVTTLDRDPHKHELAAANLEQAGLRSTVELLCGDATTIVQSLPGPFDCVFFDADRLSAPAQLQLLLPKLTPDVFLFADNILSHPTEVTDYLNAVQALPAFTRMIIPVGKGLSVAYRAKG